jgi:hypothetical protein
LPVWTVHAPPSIGASAALVEDAVIIREGFSWTAFLVPLVWALRYGLWLVFCLVLAAEIGISLWAARFGGAIGWPLMLGLMFWFGLEARNFRRAKLDHAGWGLVGIVNARTMREAERRFFEKTYRADPGTFGSSNHAAGPPSWPPAAPSRPPAPFGSALPAVVGYVAGDAR